MSRGLKVLRNYYFETKLINMVIHKQNIKDIEKIANIIKEYLVYNTKFSKLTLIPLIPVGRGR